MDSDAEEYTVESIVQARVEHKRGKKIVWHYLVKWQGYSQKDNTWEPPSSFDGGTEHVIETFWQRVNVGGRDINDASQFKKGEEVLPQGPPRGLRKQKSRSRLPPPPSPEPEPEPEPEEDLNRSSGKRRRPATNSDVEEDQPKRPRGRSKKSPTTDMPRASRSKSRAKKDISPPTQTSRRSKKSKRKSTGSNNQLGPGTSFGDPSELLPIERESTPEPMIISAKKRRRSRKDEEIIPATPEEEEPLVPDSEPPSAFVPESPKTLAKPKSRRSRTNQPLVKTMEDPNLGQGMGKAIPVKARLLGLNGSAGENSIGSSSSVPVVPPPRVVFRGPRGRGRGGKGSQTTRKGSLLTFEKGELKTIKGSFTLTGSNHKESVSDHEDIDMAMDPTPVPDNETPIEVDTGPAPADELLKLSGLDPASASALPDFEEDTVPAENAQPAPAGASPAAETPISQSLTAAMSDLFPSPPTHAAITSVVSSIAWTRSTIFGPLGIGSDVTAQGSTEGSEKIRPVFLLNLGGTISVPVALKDTRTNADSVSLDTIVAKNAKGPPGRFYQEKHVFALLRTLRATGSSARISLEKPNDLEFQDRFREFVVKLQGGDIFLVTAGLDLLVFFSSQNRDVGKELGVPELLRGLSDSVVVSRVVIEDTSGFAEAATSGDPRDPM